MPEEVKGHAFIDLDNFIIGLGKERRVVEVTATQVRDKVHCQSTKPEIDVFGNFSEQPEWVSNKLYSLGFRLIHTPSVNGKGSNLDDQEMSNCLADAAEDSSVDPVFVFSADKHFLPAVNRCRKRGKRVILFSTMPPNWALEQAASAFIPLYKSQPNAAPVVEGKPSQPESGELLRQIMTLLKSVDASVPRPELLSDLIQIGFSGREAKRALDEAIETQRVKEIKVENGDRSEHLLMLAS